MAYLSLSPTLTTPESPSDPEMPSQRLMDFFVRILSLLYAFKSLASLIYTYQDKEDSIIMVI